MERPKVWEEASNRMMFTMVQRVGMFATLTHCLLLCKFCFEKGIKPHFKFENPFYGSGDWFPDFFLHRFPNNNCDQKTSNIIHNRFDINYIARGHKNCEIHNEFKTILEGALLFDFFFMIKPEIRATLRQEEQNLLGGDDFVGVHYRG